MSYTWVEFKSMNKFDPLHFSSPTNGKNLKNIHFFPFHFSPYPLGNPGKPQHNGNNERSHLADKTEFYLLINYTDDVGLNKNLSK